MVGTRDSLFLERSIGLPLAWAAERTDPLLMRLPPQNRAIVLMSLLALVLVGVSLIAMTIFFGRRVVREARKTQGPTPSHQEDWYRKPLVPRVPQAPHRNSE